MFRKTYSQIKDQFSPGGGFRIKIFCHSVGIKCPSCARVFKKDFVDVRRKSYKIELVDLCSKEYFRFFKAEREDSYFPSVVCKECQRSYGLFKSLHLAWEAPTLAFNRKVAKEKESFITLWLAKRITKISRKQMRK
jgi:ribosomal protein S27E